MTFKFKGWMDTLRHILFLIKYILLKRKLSFVIKAINIKSLIMVQYVLNKCNAVLL